MTCVPYGTLTSSTRISYFIVIIPFNISVSLFLRLHHQIIDDIFVSLSSSLIIPNWGFSFVTLTFAPIPFTLFTTDSMINQYSIFPRKCVSSCYFTRGHPIRIVRLAAYWKAHKCFIDLLSEHYYYSRSINSNLSIVINYLENFFNEFRNRFFQNLLFRYANRR